MKKIIILVVAMFLFPFATYAQGTVTTTTATPNLVMYVREGCSHCANVKAFITKYNIGDKVKIVETYNVATAQTELDGWYDRFKIDANNRGVPFFVIDGTSYLQGDTPIIEYLTNTFNITVTEPPVTTSTTDIVFVVAGGLILFSILGYGIYTMIGKKK